MMEKEAKIYVAGHNGMVGSAICRNLKKRGFENLLLRSHAELDLTRQAETERFFDRNRPDYVFLAAAKVGGIGANSRYRGEFIYENLALQTHVIDAAYRYGVRKLVFLGSSCIYPRMAPQPIPEEALLTGPLEETNEPYAVAKIAGMKMCEAYRAQYGCNFVSVMPTNLYGPNDNYDLETSHVLPALIRKMHLGKLLAARDEAGLRKDLNARPVRGITGEHSYSEITETLAGFGILPGQVTLWGTGAPLREFLHADDMADATVFVMQYYDAPEGTNTHVNIGSGQELSIRELARIVQESVSYAGRVVWDGSKPDGTPRKWMDNARLTAMGWKPSIALADGIAAVYARYAAML